MVPGSGDGLVPRDVVLQEAPGAETIAQAGVSQEPESRGKTEASRAERGAELAGGHVRDLAWRGELSGRPWRECLEKSQHSQKEFLALTNLENQGFPFFNFSLISW